MFVLNVGFDPLSNHLVPRITSSKLQEHLALFGSGGKMGRMSGWIWLYKLLMTSWLKLYIYSCISLIPNSEIIYAWFSILSDAVCNEWPPKKCNLQPCAFHRARTLIVLVGFSGWCNSETLHINLPSVLVCWPLFLSGCFLKKTW